MAGLYSGHPWHRRGQGWICDHRVDCPPAVRAPWAARGQASIGRAGWGWRHEFLSVQADFTFLSFQGALRIAIKAPGLIVEYPIWILALSLLSLLSFRSDPILLPACWLGARSFLLIITILCLLLMHFFKHSYSRLLPKMRVAVREGAGRREPRAVPAGLRRRLGPARPRSARPRSAGGTGAARSGLPSAPAGGPELLPPAVGRGWSPVARTVLPPRFLPPFPPPRPLIFPPPHHFPRVYLIIINY